MSLLPHEDREPRALHCAVASAELGKLAVQASRDMCRSTETRSHFQMPQFSILIGHTLTVKHPGTMVAGSQQNAEWNHKWK